ncbi:hypothetical protein TNCV_2408461 [Trichonephila clavipes]|nr:hypothetical protein TNCV_2408461 [Trichonephila clavipes]
MGHGTTPLRVKEDIKDVSSKLSNGGYRLNFLKLTSRTLLLWANGDHRIISKIAKDDETYKPFSDDLTRQESKLWVFEENITPTMVKSRRTMKKSGMEQEVVHKNTMSPQPGMGHQEFCNIKTVISSHPDMEHQEGCVCGIETLISSQPGIEHQESCDVKNVISSEPSMDHLEVCDIKTLSSS